MHSATIVILLAYVAQTDAQEWTANHIRDAQNSMYKPLDKLANRLVDRLHLSMDKFVKELSGKLFDKPLMASPSYLTRLDATTLGKPGHLAIERRTTLKSLSQHVRGAPDRRVKMAAVDLGKQQDNVEERSKKKNYFPCSSSLVTFQSPMALIAIARAVGHGGGHQSFV